MKISKKATTIAIVNQKGGTGKTTTWDELPVTLSTLMQKAMNDQCIPPGEGVLYHVPSPKTIAFLTKDTHKNFPP